MANSNLNPVFFFGESTGTATTGTVVVGTTTADADKVKSVVFVAKSNNVGTCFITGREASGTNLGTAVNGGMLAGDALPMTAANWLSLRDLFLTVTTTGEGVDIIAVKA
jgi:hypothetical protein